jgi:hypothetical protein
MLTVTTPHWIITLCWLIPRPCRRDKQIRSGHGMAQLQIADRIHIAHYSSLIPYRHWVGTGLHISPDVVYFKPAMSYVACSFISDNQQTEMLISVNPYHSDHSTESIRKTFGSAPSAIFCSTFYEVFSVTRQYSDDVGWKVNDDDEQTRTNIHALSGIRTHGLSVQVIQGLRLRPREHWDRWRCCVYSANSHGGGPGSRPGWCM